MNKYELLEIIGEGAYGIVIKAKSKETNEHVAIKKFKEKDDNEDVKRSIYRELKMLKALRGSENIVTLKEAYRKRGNIYFVFEYVDRNMLQLLESNPQGLPFITIKNLMFQLCKAIEWCHSREIIHRDIKPENLLISNDGRLKLCDFGFARRIAHDTHNLALTEYVATRWYRPPELLLNCSYGKPVDIWALGTIFGELTDGQPLFAGDSDIDQLYVIQQVLGPLPQYQLEALQKNKKFNSYKFPRAIDCTTLFKRYENSANELVLDFIDNCLQLDPVKRMTIGECLTHKLFRPQNDELKSAKITQSGRRRRAHTIHESSSIPIDLKQEQQSHKGSLNDLLDSQQSKKRTGVESSMSILTYSPRNTNITDQELLSNKNADEPNESPPQKTSIVQNGNTYLGVPMKEQQSLNFHNSSSSFIFKSKEHLTEENLAAFNKFSSKYNSTLLNSNSVNSSTNNLLLKSPRDKNVKYIYYGNSQNSLAELNSDSIQHKPSKLYLNKDDTQDSLNIIQTSKPYGFPLNSNVYVTQDKNIKIYRSDSRLENYVKLPGFTRDNSKLFLKSSKRSKTSMDMNQDDNKEQERDNGDYQNYIINTNQLTNKTKHYQSQQQQQPSIPKYVSQNQHQQQVKQLTNHLSFKNPIHKVKKMTDLNINTKNDTKYSLSTQNHHVINHFDRSISQLSKRNTFNFINGNSLGTQLHHQSNTNSYLLRTKK